jgi:hypothetical protein
MKLVLATLFLLAALAPARAQTCYNNGYSVTCYSGSTATTCYMVGGGITCY